MGGLHRFAGMTSPIFGAQEKARAVLGPAWVGAVLIGLVLGGLTQLSQTYLPDFWRSISNSGAPWVLITFAAAMAARSATVAALHGWLTLTCLELGYVVVASWRGFPSSATTVSFWLIVALVLGPPTGLAGYLLRTGAAPWAGLAGGLTAGIVSGEGLASYETVRATTNPEYWIGQMIVGVVLLLVVARRTGLAAASAGFLVGVAALLMTRHLPVFGA